ncbi:hypothetical protein WMO40_19830, partial [Bacillaceae bacterium CLA-AA-H227]
TRKLSFSAPMVVRGCPLVRVGRCRAKTKEYPKGTLFLIEALIKVSVEFITLKNRRKNSG